MTRKVAILQNITREGPGLFLQVLEVKLDSAIPMANIIRYN